MCVYLLFCMACDNLHSGSQACGKFLVLYDAMYVCVIAKAVSHQFLAIEVWFISGYCMGFVVA